MSNAAQAERPMGILGDQSKVLQDFKATWHSSKPQVFHIFHIHEGEKAPFNGCIPVDKKDHTKGMKCRNCNKEVPKALLFTVVTRKF